MQTLVLPDLDTLEHEMERVRSTTSQVQGEQKGILVQREQLEGQLSTVDGLTTCPTCLQEVTEEHRHSVKEEAEKRMEAWTKKLDDLSREEKRIQHEGTQLRERIAQARTIQTEMENLRARHSAECVVREELKAKEQERITLQIELKTAQDAIASLPQPQEMDRRIQEAEKNLDLLLARQQNNERRHSFEEKKALLENQITSAQQSLSAAKEQHERLMKERDALHFSEEEASVCDNAVFVLKKESTEIRQKIESEAERFSSLRTRTDMLKKQREELETRIASFVTLEKRLKETEDLEYWLQECFIPLMATMEKHTLTTINREFNAFFTSWFQMLVEDSNLTVHVDDEFAPSVIQDGYPMSVTHLSGGEKTAVALAYRLALNKVINSLIDTIATREVIILDEPTDGFSGEQLDRVKDVLDELHTAQTIIVSHDPKVEAFVESVIEITKKEHESRIE